MTDKIKEKIRLRDTDDFITNFNKETKALLKLKAKPLSYSCTEITRSCTRINLKGLGEVKLIIIIMCCACLYLAGVIGEENFVKYLCRLVLDCINFDQMWRIPSSTRTTVRMDMLCT